MLKTIITQPFILPEMDLLTIFNLERSVPKEIRFSIHQPSPEMQITWLLLYFPYGLVYDILFPQNLLPKPILVD
jgi:hypothetical protein